MRRIKSADAYVEKCRLAEEGDVMARLEVNAHRLRASVVELKLRVEEITKQDWDWGPVLDAVDDLLEDVAGEGDSGEFASNRTLGLAGLVANALHDLRAGDPLSEANMDNLSLVCECWEKLSHVQYLIGMLYPNYIQVLMESRSLVNGGLVEYGEQMQADAKDVLCAE
ncbi:MAG: hypothetical protein OXH22_03880 [Chloroflexi bacterium]|nr:hypothetical protein [Chloroflexota bacterium]